MLTIVVKEVLVGSVPNLLCDGAACVEVHTHTLLLRTLSGEDVGGDWLLNLGLTNKNLIFGLLVASLDIDDLTT